MSRVLALWSTVRAAQLAAVVAVAAWVGIGADPHPLAAGTWWLERFVHWDSYHFVRIADAGYFAAGPCCDQSYFPGYPLTMRALAPLTGGSVALAGLVVSLACGLVAASFLWRLGGPWAVAALSLAPASVFLGTVYSEALWLAAALAAWSWAGRDRWWLAGAAGAVASATRVTGLFLWCGLVVAYAVRSRSAPGRPRVRRDVLALLLPLLPVLGYAAWLRGRTGSWDAWRAAQAVGWGRSTVTPWAGASRQWHEVLAAGSPYLAVTRLLDLVAVLLGVALVGVVAWRRRWAELAYLVPGVGSVLASNLWDSAARYALAWFPAYLLLARAHDRARLRPLVGAVLVASGFVAAVVTWLWATWRWAG